LGSRWPPPHPPAWRPSREASSPENGLSNLLREFLGRQSSGSVDLDHAVPAPSKWPFPLLRQRLEEASYDPLSSVIARSIADFDTVSQPASGHCPDLRDRLDRVKMLQVAEDGAASSASADTAPLIALRGISRIHDGGAIAALKNVDLRIEAGDLVAIVGASGSGRAPVRWASRGVRSSPKRKVRPGRPTPEHSRSVNDQARAQHPLRAPNVAFRILFTSSPRRPISYTFVGSLGCRDRRAVWRDRAPADINNIAGAATRR